MATLQPGEKSRMYALGGIARGGAFRGGYVDSRMYINIDGDQIGWASDDDAHGVLLGTLTITDILDETPNTCSFRVNGYVPEDGAALVITRGSKNAAPLFAGYALTVQQLYAGVPRNVQADVRAVDYTWLLAMQKVTRQYRTQSATAIITDLVATFAAVNGFTTVHVVAGLPVLDVITFTDEDLPDAITRTCRRIGAYWYVDYRKDVHVFFEDTSRTPPAPLVPTHKSLTNFTRSHERTQGLTRVYVEGRGSRLLGAVTAGETLLPLEAVDMFTAAADTFLKVSVQGADSALHLNFGGVVAGGRGALVGPGIGPGSAVTLAAQVGAGLEEGAHGYATTFTTASGESLPSPIATITVGSVANPLVPIDMLTTSPTYSVVYRFSVTVGDNVAFQYAYSTGPPGSRTQMTAASPESIGIITVSDQDPYNPGEAAPVHMRVPYSADPRVTTVYVYMRAASRPGDGSCLIAWIANHPEGAGPGAGQTFSTDGTGYGSPAFPPPGTNTTAQSQVLVSAIPIGATTVTGRKLYRTAANLAQLKLLTTIANNTATTHTDTAADAALGANVPTADTSGLQQPDGQIVPGSTALPVAGTSPFVPSGGWAVIGNGDQVIRYSGLSASALTGIPASGIGAITATVAYNSTVTATPMLTGIPASGTRSLPHPLVGGDEVYSVVQVDDTARQAQLAADLNVSSGIREEWVSDRRLSILEARARGQATLLSRPLVDATVEYACRDTRTGSGLTIHIDLPPPTDVAGDYKIQSVTWSNFRPRPEQPPTAQVTASSRRFSFEDLLRIVKTKD